MFTDDVEDKVTVDGDVLTGVNRDQRREHQSSPIPVRLHRRSVLVGFDEFRV
jgi:hypothetical protein